MNTYKEILQMLKHLTPFDHLCTFCLNQNMHNKLVILTNYLAADRYFHDLNQRKHAQIQPIIHNYHLASLNYYHQDYLIIIKTEKLLSRNCYQVMTTC